MCSCGERTIGAVLRLTGCALALFLASNSVQAFQSRMPRVVIPQPATNLPAGPPIADDTRVVYVVTLCLIMHIMFTAKVHRRCAATMHR